MVDPMSWRERMEQSPALPTAPVPIQCELWAVPMRLATPIRASTVEPSTTLSWCSAPTG